MNPNEVSRNSTVTAPAGFVFQCLCAWWTLVDGPITHLNATTIRWFNFHVSTSPALLSLRSTFRIVAQKYFSREEASITSDTNSRAMTPFQRAYLGNALISPWFRDTSVTCTFPGNSSTVQSSLRDKSCCADSRGSKTPLQSTRFSFCASDL
jgi:hypothetical protein